MTDHMVLKEMCLNDVEELEPIIFEAYFEAKISTDKAAKILNKTIPEFVECYDHWLV